MDTMLKSIRKGILWIKINIWDYALTLKLIKKLKSLAEFNGRSINGEILYLIRQAISQHEQKHGTLE